MWQRNTMLFLTFLAFGATESFANCWSYYHSIIPSEGYLARSFQVRRARVAQDADFQQVRIPTDLVRTEIEEFGLRDARLAPTMRELLAEPTVSYEAYLRLFLEATFQREIKDLSQLQGEVWASLIFSDVQYLGLLYLPTVAPLSLAARSRAFASGFIPIDARSIMANAIVSFDLKSATKFFDQIERVKTPAAARDFFERLGEHRLAFEDWANRNQVLDAVSRQDVELLYYIWLTRGLREDFESFFAQGGTFEAKYLGKILEQASLSHYAGIYEAGSSGEVAPPIANTGRLGLARQLLEAAAHNFPAIEFPQ